MIPGILCNVKNAIVSIWYVISYVVWYEHCKTCKCILQDMIKNTLKIEPSTSKNRIHMHTRALIKSLAILSLLLLLIISYEPTYGQTEDDVIKKAQSFFDKQSYQEALPLFAQLVSVHPENPEYNYKFGVCTLYGDRSDRRRPIRYLTIALRSIKDDPKLHYYLGLAYYQNQEFADAMKYLNLYLAKLGSDSPERPAILEKVNACLNGMNLEHKNIISEIISTSEFQMDNFHRAYKANEFDGMLILKPDMFITSQEKKKGENSFVFIPQLRKYLYYSGYDANSNQRDLYVVEMTPEGDWGDPSKLPETINTSFDEDYPIAVNGGLTLYFCSKGHNSLGGYDIYKTTYDTINKAFSDPENLGVGINSPFDDLMFIPDKTGKFAYFSTNRDNLNGTINVYKIRLIENSLQQDQFLAENVIKSNLGQQYQAQPQQTVQPVNVQPASSQTQSKAVASTAKSTELSPSERAAKMKNERSIMTQYADTSYRLITETKALVRDLTNKRDRANAVVQKKEEAAKTLEVKFAEMTTSMASVESEVEFEKMLENAIVLKKEIYQYRQRAKQANLVAWNLGKQIKIKNQELEKIKAGAGSVQSHSIGGDMEQTRIAYLDLKTGFNLADTLTDYTDALFALTSDEVKFDVPATELAFADNLRKGYQSNTLLAAANKKPVQEDIPIVIVDKRTATVAQTPAKPKITAKPVVEAIAISSLAFADPQIDEEALELNFTVDAIDALKLVEIVNPQFLAQNIEIDETELEINLRMDLPEVLPLVESIQYVFNDILPEDEALEISSFIDAIEPLNLVETVSAEGLFAEFVIEDESLEINSRVDAIAPEGVVEPVYVLAQNSIMVDETELEINSSIDAIEPTMLVETVNSGIFAFNFDIEEEELEIRNSVDAILPEGVVEPVYAMLNDPLNLDNEELNIDFSVDAINAIPQVEFVDVDLTQMEFAIEDEPLEMDMKMEAIQALELIKQVTFDEQAYASTEPEEESLDISIEEEYIKVTNVPEPIIVASFASTFPEEETLEINIEENLVDVYNVVEPIHTSFAANEIPDEVLEMGDVTPDIKATVVVEPVIADALAFEEINISDEELEISTDGVQAMNLVSPVYASTFVPAQPDEEELEIRFDRYEQILVTMPKQVQPVTFAYRLPAEIDLDEEDVVINFGIDQSKDQVLMASADNSGNVGDHIEKLPEMPSSSSEVLYLRESVSLSHEIETSKSDMEMLRTAMVNPEDLEYEELLFAASLTSNPQDQMRIYRTAFVHLDRDWRAFNNAAVSSMNVRELNQAEVFLYQASLLSQDNGKIYNNMGILACYKNDYEKARDYFVTALQFGVNSEYNLSVLKTMTESNSFTSEQLHQEIGEHRYFEVLGDAINYNTSR